MPKVSGDYLAARRDHILAAAAGRFAGDGFHRTSMQDVIAASGLSAGAVYRYFRGKDEIITAISTEVMAVVETAVRDALHAQRPIGDLLAQIPATIARLDRADDRVRLAVQVWGEALRNAAVGAAVQAGLSRIRTELSARVAAAREAGEISTDADPDALASVLLATVQGYILQRAWRLDLSAEDYGRAVHELVAGRLAA